MKYEHMLTRHAFGDRLDRHRHERAYAAVVLEGGYCEAGDRGRFVATAGKVVFHGPHEAHLNAFHAHGAVVLNLPINCSDAPLARVSDPDEIARLAERDIRAACEYLAISIVPVDCPIDDWPNQLARRLIANPDLDLRTWAVETGLAPQSLSRGFRQVFGVTPKRFRAEQRALHALRLLPNWDRSGAALAAELGFADQAHMTRSVRAIAGKTPSAMHVK